MNTIASAKGRIRERLTVSILVSRSRNPFVKNDYPPNSSILSVIALERILKKVGPRPAARSPRRGLAGRSVRLTPLHTRDQLRRVLRTSFGIHECEQSHVLDALTPTRLAKGQRLSVGDHALAILGIVTTGCLRVYFTEADGSDRVLYFAPEGWCVADIDGFTADRPTPLLIDALETTDVWLLDAWGRTMRGGLSEGERVCRSLAESALRTLQKRLVGSMRKTAAQRYLDFQALYPGLDCRISQYHVAAYLGISPEFLSKLRKHLIRDARS